MQAPFDISKLSTKPGCYLYKDILGEIIYIGKAKNLKKRVSSYFSKDHVDIKTTVLVQNIKEVDTIITPNEMEALLLESQLIKKHKPRYNIDLKYGIRYAWIVLTNEKFPRLLTVRKHGMDGEYFGPFVKGYGRKQLIDILQKKFFIRTCRTLPKKSCLRYHINICKAPCIKEQSHEEYMVQVEQVRKYLQGKNKELVSELQKEMNKFSAEQKYELAQQRRDQITALETVQERIVVENTRDNEEDVINYKKIILKGREVIRFLVFSFRRGVLVEKEEYDVAQEDNVLDEFIKRYYEVAIIPKTIIIPHAIYDKEIIPYLENICEHKVELVVPQRGLKKDMLNLATTNLEAGLSEAENLAHEFMETLELEKPVRTIECFDISHLSGTNMVGSMSYFKDGKPLKSMYRKFNIKTVVGIDDFRAMKEVVGRRYKRLLEENKEFPDLIVIDGGAIQLDFAKQALDELGLNIPIIGLAKKFEEIYFPETKEPNRYNKKSAMMKAIIWARDETHRFGITFHRKKRSKAAKK